MVLRIYGAARTRTSRTLWMAGELGIPYDHVPTAVGEETLSPAFIALNPYGRVPVIDDDGTVIWESLAINLYLAKRYGGVLAPRDLAEDAEMTMWTLWAATELEPDAHEVLRHTLLLSADQRDGAVVEAAMARLHRPLSALERGLERGGSLVGGRFTVADLNAACVVFYLRGLSSGLAAFPRVSAWYRAATDRLAFQAMMRLRGDA